jgi:DNA adenine methylase
MAVSPFLKWPGGKRWFISRYSSLLPTRFNTYFEPFLGAGSVFFHLKPPYAVLGDVNADVVDLYRAVAWRRISFEIRLQEHQERHGKRYYYDVRRQVPQALVERAARTLYLNRTSFNGMYRVNQAGEFNVPKGVKTKVVMDTDDFVAAAKLLRSAKIRVSDFEPLIDEASARDLVFADPPYVVGHNNNGFVKYNEKLFKWDDQIRLANALNRARKRKVKIVATNAAHADVEQLYKKRGFFIHQVERYSSISGSSHGRCKFREIVITANCD